MGLCPWHQPQQVVVYGIISSIASAGSWSGWTSRGRARRMETLTLRPETAAQVRGLPAPAPALAALLSTCPGPWDALLRTLAGRTQRFQRWARGVGRGVSSQPRLLPERHCPGPVGWTGPPTPPRSRRPRAW
ncbi:hypothetical protein CapIbe_016087 [Capra ibex]